MREMKRILCDRCGKDIHLEFRALAGNCTSCGDNLCTACAGAWNEYGECAKCQEKNREEEK